MSLSEGYSFCEFVCEAWVFSLAVGLCNYGTCVERLIMSIMSRSMMSVGHTLCDVLKT